MSDPWFSQAPPGAQVARDMALEMLHKDPLRPGYRWANEHSKWITLPVGPELLPGILYQDLVAAGGNIQKLRPEFVLPEFVPIPGQPWQLTPTPITQAQWASITGQNPSEFAGNPQHPVEQISFHDAIWFCRQLEVAAGLRSHSIRLPSVEEWAYAAQAGEPWKYAGSDETDEIAWYERNSGDRTHPVATKKPNAWGLYDMNGNVEEWTTDVEWDYQILCGGNFGSFPRYMILPARNQRLEDERTGYAGCRLLWEIG